MPVTQGPSNCPYCGHTQVVHVIPKDARTAVASRCLSCRRTHVSGEAAGSSADPHAPVRTNRRGPYSCPECGGVLSHVEDNDDVQLVCHSHHRWGIETLTIAKSRALEQAAMDTIVLLHEKATLLRELAIAGGMLDSDTTALIEQAHEDDECARRLHAQVLGTDIVPSTAVLQRSAPYVADADAEVTCRPLVKTTSLTPL